MTLLNFNTKFSSASPLLSTLLFESFSDQFTTQDLCICGLVDLTNMVFVEFKCSCEMGREIADQEDFNLPVARCSKLHSSSKTVAQTLEKPCHPFPTRFFDRKPPINHASIILLLITGSHNLSCKAIVLLELESHP